MNPTPCPWPFLKTKRTIARGCRDGTGASAMTPLTGTAKGCGSSSAKTHSDYLPMGMRVLRRTAKRSTSRRARKSAIMVFETQGGQRRAIHLDFQGTVDSLQFGYFPKAPMARRHAARPICHLGFNDGETPAFCRE